MLAFVAFGAAALRTPNDLNATVNLASPDTVATPGDLAQGSPASQPDTDWRAYGRGGYGDRFSPLAQITADNVKNLQVAWTFHTGDMHGANDPKETTSEATPVKAKPHGVSLLAASDRVCARCGERHAEVEVRSAPARHTVFSAPDLPRRFLSRDPGRRDRRRWHRRHRADCPRRIFLGTNDAEMFALNADTGQPCESFGTHGKIDLNVGMPVTDLGFYEVTSPPVVTDRMLIVGGSVIDNYSTHEPSGVIRGFDVYSGRLVWAFDAGNADVNEMPSATHSYSPSSPNSWSVSSADEALGMVYVPLGSSDPDIWAGNRDALHERYDSALVALDIATGKLRWSFQNVHHDLWDMDMSSQPSLVDVHRGADIVPAIYIPAKTGNIFVLDRRDGKLIVPAPKPRCRRDRRRATGCRRRQPFSGSELPAARKARRRHDVGCHHVRSAVLPDRIQTAALRRPVHAALHAGNAGVSWRFRNVRMGRPRGRSAASDRDRQPDVDPVRLAAESRADRTIRPHQTARIRRDPSWACSRCTALRSAYRSGHFFSPIKLPCLQPPWGYVAAIDMKTNTVVWQHPVGTIRDSAPVPIPLKIGHAHAGRPDRNRGRGGLLDLDLWTTTSAPSTCGPASRSGRAACPPAASPRR